MEPVHQPSQPDTKPAPHPVMDVVPPRSPQPTAAAPAPAPVQASAPQAPQAHDHTSGQVEAVHMPPEQKVDVPPADAGDKKKKQSAPKPPKPPRSGVGMAVFATVVIALGLGALVVYAYLRTNGISTF